jgi:hypothetical protein
MKTIKFTILALIIVVFTSTSFSEYLTPELLRCPQWKSSWCWAGAAQACLSFYGFDHDSLSNEDCAHVITTNNDPQPMRVITTIINHFLPDYAYSPANDLRSEDDFKAEADSCAPFACFWPGHFVTYAGYEGDKHLIMNPWPYGTDSSTAGAWEENCTYNYIADKTSSYVRTKGMPREPFIKVNAPGDGEEVEQNSIVNIRWGDNIDGEVKIELLKNDVVLEVLAASTPSNGSWEWEVTVGYELGDDYKIQITSIDSSALTTKNKEPFSIVEEFIVSVFPYIIDFDDLTHGTTILPEKWKQIVGDNLDWTVWSGKTPTKEPDQGAATGPDNDHTLNNSTGKYIYIESSGSNNPDKTATYVTPKVNVNILSKPELSFWYHMFSDNEGVDEMGDLYLDISVDGTWNNDVFHINKDQQDVWHEKVIDLEPYKGDRVIFRFRGVTGSGWASDICIDDFKIDGTIPISHNFQHALSWYDLRVKNSFIQYQIPKRDKPLMVNIVLYDLQGRLVRTLVNGVKSSGLHSVGFTGSELAAGTYLCQMKTGEFTKTIKVLLKE